MRPYFAIVKDSFREALRSLVLWISLGLITLALLVLAPLGSREERTTLLTPAAVPNWQALAERMHEQSGQLTSSPGKHLWSQFDAKLRDRLSQLDALREKNRNEYDDALRDLRTALNELLPHRDFYDRAAWRGIDLGKEGQALLARRDSLSADETMRLHRIALERAFVGLMFESPEQNTVLTYAGAVVQPEWLPPVKPEAFRRGVRWLVNTGSNWFVGGIGILVAIVITASIMPRMFDPGQLHLLLSKPVSRSLLLLAQYVGACIFITIIVSYLAVGVWLILGWRLEIWDARLLWIIPIYILAFAIYYAVSTVAAVVTRSAIVAIMASMLFWLVCFGIGTLKLDLDRRARVSQFHRLVPAGDDLLAVNEHNTVFAWNDDERRWDRVFVSKFQQELRQVSWLPLPAMPPMPGLVYDAENQQIIAVERPPDSPFRATLAVGRARNDWSYTIGAAPPMRTFAVVREPQGTVLMAGSMGLFRLRGDPTAQRKPIKVLGVELPLSTGAVFQDLSPEEGLLLPAPSAIALDRQSGDVFAYSRGELLHLRGGKERFEIVSRGQVEAKDTEAIVLAATSQRLLLARADGRLQTLDRATLAEVSSTTPEPESRVRFLEVSPDGAQVAATFHNETLWLYDAAQDTWQRAPVSGQGEISTAHWADDGALYVADRATRVSVYEPGSLAVRERYAPAWSLASVGHRYLVAPLYYVFPKPGELYKSFDHLVQPADDAAANDEEAGTARSNANPLAPVWSGLAFIAAMLAATCLYFERQEY